jgi:hypothetical protein
LQDDFIDEVGKLLFRLDGIELDAAVKLLLAACGPALPPEA